MIKKSLRSHIKVEFKVFYTIFALPWKDPDRDPDIQIRVRTIGSGFGRSKNMDSDTDPQH
jgi:hypothetical protein